MKLTILLTLGFKKAYERASNWIRKTPWNSLFLDLPIESETFVNAYAEGKLDEGEFWNNFILLTGLSKPFINSLKLRFQPILNCIKDTCAGEKEIHCYLDLMSYIKEKKILEKILFLELRYRLTKKLDLKEWKKTLFKEMKNWEGSWPLAVERILEESVRKYDNTNANIILYRGSLKSIKYLKRPNNEIEIILLDNYWKSPLDILRTILWKYGFDNTPDEKIEQCLKFQKNYLDLVIHSKDNDEAHDTWTKMVQKL